MSVLHPVGQEGPGQERASILGVSEVFRVTCKDFNTFRFLFFFSDHMLLPLNRETMAY